MRTRSFDPIYRMPADLSPWGPPLSRMRMVFYLIQRILQVWYWSIRSSIPCHEVIHFSNLDSCLSKRKLILNRKLKWRRVKLSESKTILSKTTHTYCSISCYTHWTQDSLSYYKHLNVSKCAGLLLTGNIWTISSCCATLWMIIKEMKNEKRKSPSKTEIMLKPVWFL